MNSRKIIRAAVLVDSDAVPRWMAEAIRLSLLDGVNVPLILHCTTKRRTVFAVRNLLYYALNILVMRRGKEEAPVLLRELGLSGAEVFRFEAEDGIKKSWQRIPPSVAQRIREMRCDVVIKAGMGLLENPSESGARLGVLSYHHGDPSKFRGRPAGFWETLLGERTMGMMVQRIDNTLDAGHVLAFGRAKIYPHSYRKTLSVARETSAHLLRKAIRSAESGVIVDMPRTGKNYRLPSNTDVVRFMAGLIAAKARRVFFACFYSKEWKVGLVPSIDRLDGDNRLEPVPPLRPSSRHAFLADCFFSRDGSILAEAMIKSHGVAEIVKYSGGSYAAASFDEHRHWSYPFPIIWKGHEYILPEVAEWSSPFMFNPEERPFEKIYLKGLEGERIVDATLLSHDNIWYLFGTRRQFANEQLCLWVSAEGPDGPFIAHPDSPVVLDVTCARMAGAVINDNGRLLRLGQNFSEGYGSSISVSEVTCLSPQNYSELKIGTLSMIGCKGPHTYSVHRDKAAIDWYREAFDPFALYGRIKSLLARR
jgi:hypothetical protein